MEKNEKHENNKKMVGTAKGLYLLARNLTCKKISDLEKESTENPENFDMDFVRIVKNKTTIQIDQLSQGLYLFKLIGDNNSFGYGKFIVK